MEAVLPRPPSRLPRPRPSPFFALTRRARSRPLSGTVLSRPPPSHHVRTRSDPFVPAEPFARLRRTDWWKSPPFDYHLATQEILPMPDHLPAGSPYRTIRLSD